MKKMMMIAVAFMVAVGVNAGTVNWTTASALRGVDSATGLVTASAVTATYTSYLFVVAAGSGQAAFDALVSNMTTGNGTDRAGFVAANDGVSKYITTAYTAGKINQTTKASSLVQNSTRYDAYMITFDPTGGNEYFEAALVKDVLSTGTGTLAATFAVSNYQIGSGWTAIAPEPTSMALLALGGAVFGLRRKFRK